MSATSILAHAAGASVSSSHSITAMAGKKWGAWTQIGLCIQKANDNETTALVTLPAQLDAVGDAFEGAGQREVVDGLTASVDEATAALNRLRQNFGDIATTRLVVAAAADDLDIDVRDLPTVVDALINELAVTSQAFKAPTITVSDVVSRFGNTGTATVLVTRYMDGASAPAQGALAHRRYANTLSCFPTTDRYTVECTSQNVYRLRGSYSKIPVSVGGKLAPQGISVPSTSLLATQSRISASTTVTGGGQQSLRGVFVCAKLSVPSPVVTGTISIRPTGGAGGISVNMNTLTTTATQYTSFATCPDTIPTSPSITVTMSSTAYVDELIILPVLYHEGLGWALLPGSTTPVRGDKWQVAVTNDEAAKFMRAFTRGLLRLRFQPPYSGSPTISDTLAGGS
jgi:hypothetical protein